MRPWHPANTSLFTVPAGYLVGGGEYAVAVTVTSFLGGAATATRAVRQSPGPAPAVTVAVGLGRKCSKISFYPF